MTTPNPDQAHHPHPVFGTAYTVGAGKNTNLPADLKRHDHYPVEAFCDCGEIIRMEHIGQRLFEHTGRKPGETTVDTAANTGQRA